MPLVSLNGPKTEKRAGACASQLIVCALLYIRGRRKAKLAADNGSRARVSAAAACLFSPFQLEAFERTCVCSEKAQPHDEITGSHISRLVARDFFFSAVCIHKCVCAGCFFGEVSGPSCLWSSITSRAPGRRPAVGM